MAHGQEKRDKVRQLYISGGQSLEIAAALAEVSFGTARRWKNEDKAAGKDWDKLRAAYTMAGASVEDLSRSMLSGFLVQYNNTMTMLQDASTEELMPSERAKLLSMLSDSFAKTVAANARVMPETSKLATALMVLDMLGGFVAEKHPKHLQAFVEVLEPFGAEVERKFG